jgi:hypothetical protein
VRVNDGKDVGRAICRHDRHNAEAASGEWSHARILPLPLSSLNPERA